MKNILRNQSFKLICCLAIATLMSIGMPARAGENGPLKTPQATAADTASHKTGDIMNWCPTTTIPDLKYNDLPISEVAQNLKQVFKDQFDVLLPPSGQVDYMNCTVKLELKNVTAAEIFNAMNLVFEAGNTPFRWEMIRNGNRPTALLRPLAENPNLQAIDPTTGLPNTSPVRQPEKPMVFFVGDLTDNTVEGTMTMDRVLETVKDLCASSNVPVSVSGHQEAELLVARGTESDLKFVQETLEALRQKVKLDTERKAEEKRSKTNATNKP